MLVGYTVPMDRSLYQTHRPKQFKEVIGQPQVVTVLEKAIKRKTISNAYMFTGARGTGKTSVARIFAKSLNCADVDIFEIDAASHTSVDHIRELNASVYSLPVQSDYKIYILDEAHMLSKSAFNAFLKTLEEPPAYAVFILATTEADKIPETVVSRCMHLPFHQPSLSVLRQFIVATAKKEKRTLTDQAVSLLALIAEGSFRDALSILQKVLIVADTEKIETSLVEEIIGAPRHQLVNEYLQALLDTDVPVGVKALSTAVEAHTSMALFTKLAIRKVRATLLFRGGYKVVSGEYDEDDQKFIQKLAEHKALSTKTLRDLLQASIAIQHSYIKQLPLETLLIPSQDTT